MKRRVHEVRELNLVTEPDRAEEAANRILEAFGLDEGRSELTDDQFDRVCDLIEKAGRQPMPAKVCQLLASAHLPQDVVSAVLLTLLKDHFKRLRERLVRVADKQRTLDEVLFTKESGG